MLLKILIASLLLLGQCLAGQRYSFLHMTDLHISRSRDTSLKNLKAFCDKVFARLVADGDVLFLAITGDFTDGIDSFLAFSEFGQQETDWKAYREAIDGCMHNQVPILKIRGNHDSFNVESFHHESNVWFRTYQAESRGNLKNDKIVHHSSTGSYAFFDQKSGARFVFVEASRIIPSPHQYHGEFSESQEEWVKKFISDESNTKAVRTYVFTHYPLGSLTPDSRQRILNAVSPSRSQVVYLSGHIHSVVGSRGVQALNSHEKVDELQLSDFKRSGIVRKVDVETSTFVDIDVVDHDLVSLMSASVLIDPVDRSRSLLSIYSEVPIEAVTECGKSAPLRYDHTVNKISTFAVQSRKIPCLDVATTTGNHKVYPADTRLWVGSVHRWVFSHFFEFLQIILLVEYLISIWVVRKFYLKTGLMAPTLYFLLSPLIPGELSEGVFKRRWMLSNAVAMFDLETFDVFLDSESVKVGITLLLYLICASALNWKFGSKERPKTTFRIWSFFLVILTFFNLRFAVARGGLRTLTLSPHTWFMAYFWSLWLRS